MLPGVGKPLGRSLNFTFFTVGGVFICYDLYFLLRGTKLNTGFKHLLFTFQFCRSLFYHKPVTNHLKLVINYPKNRFII
jgi:hypothetical protein